MPFSISLLGYYTSNMAICLISFSRGSRQDSMYSASEIEAELSVYIQDVYEDTLPNGVKSGTPIILH